MGKFRPLPPDAPTEPIWYLRGIPYGEYRQTNWWRVRRTSYVDKIIADYGRKICELCGLDYFDGRDINVRFSVHHLTYRNIGYERDSDLMLVCGPCHNLIHFPDSPQARHWVKFNDDDIAERAAAVCPAELSVLVSGG